MTITSDEDDAGKPSKVGLKVSNGFNIQLFLFSGCFYCFVCWPRIRNVVRLRMLLDFFRCPVS